jgi:hypothetical protein
MVFAIQCPNPKCRKFMLVEEQERGKIVTCLLCREPIQVGDKPEKKEKPASRERQRPE